MGILNSIKVNGETAFKYIKDLAVKEYLQNPFLAQEDDKKQDLTTVRSEADLLNQLSIINDDAFFSMRTQKQIGEYIPMWRNLVSRNIEVEEAVTEIVNEAVVVEDEDIIKLDFKDRDSLKKENTCKKIEEEWTYIYNLINIETNITTWFTNFYVDGVLIAENIYDNDKINEGIQKIDLLDPIGMIKTKNKSGREVYKKTKNTLNYNMDSFEKMWYEEQISMATSGLFDHNLSIYLSYLNYSVRSINQLNAIENSLVIYALTRSTEKLIYHVDTGDLPHAKARAKVEAVARDNSSNIKYDSTTGEISNIKDKIKLSKEIFLGNRGGEKGTTIESLSSDQLNLGELPALEYFLDKVYRTLKVPRLRKKEEAMFNYGDSSEVERQELNFYKFIVRMRKRFNVIFMDIMKKHLVAKKVLTEEEWDNEFSRQIRFKYANNNNYDELKKIAQLRMKLDLLREISEYTVKGGEDNDEMYLFSMEYVKKHIMNWTDKEIEEYDKMITKEIDKKKAEQPEPEPEVDPDEGKAWNDLDSGGSKKGVDKIYEEPGAGELRIDLSLEAFEQVAAGLKDGDEVIINDGTRMAMNKGKLKRI